MQMTMPTTDDDAHNNAAMPKTDNNAMKLMTGNNADDGQQR
jgi:hypothetical protein